MALPQQAAERLQRSGAKETRGTYFNLLFFSGALFAISVVAYAGLQFGYIPYLESSLDDLEARITQFSQEISAEEQEEIIQFYSQLLNLRALLRDHAAFTPAFDLLEREVAPGVFFTGITADIARAEMRLEGAADELDSVALQASLFENAEGVAEARVERASQDAQSQWDFSMVLTLEQNLLRGSTLAEVQ